MKRAISLLAVFVCLAYAATAQQYPVTQGTLTAFGEKGGLGACPLKQTYVKADITGFLARVTVKQEFENTFDRPIEAVYTFPLSEKGAVDRMTMTIGSRVISGRILRREEARKTYEAAKNAGQTAALLDQERPNIFTQSVANILPGEKIVVEISYVETLKYEEGVYEFVFPMVVGPRYIPRGKSASGADRVPDASKISPKVTLTRAGHDISIEVNIDAGVPLVGVESKLHAIETQSFGAGSAKVSLKDEATIPNKDFVLRYGVSGGRVEDALITHRDARGGFFTLILQPPDLGVYEDVAPKEIVFVLDTSGSMGGFPIEKAKEAMKMSLLGLYPEDTFNLITFAGDTRILFDRPVPASEANIETAMDFLENSSGGGGTEMMKAIRAALDPSDSQEHIRIVCFMTDGYIGNEGEIIAEVQKHPKARVFSFGIGNSVNRFLLEKIAEEGNGEAAIVTLEDEGAEAARRFYQRVRAPILTDISIDWNGMPVADTYPEKIPDLFSAKPVIINGRYTGAASGSIVLRGKVGGQMFEREIKVDLPEAEAEHDVLATLWARKRIEELTKGDYEGVQSRTADGEVAAKITGVALEFGILSQYTSFVAVEERKVNPGGGPTRVDVPVDLAEGTFGDGTEQPGLQTVASSQGDIKRLNSLTYNTPTTTNSGVAIVTRSGSGGGSGSGTGYGNGAGGVTATVDVSSSSLSIDSSESRIETTVSRDTIEALPSGTSFGSLLMLAPGTRKEPLTGGFQIDGASASEAVILIDGQEAVNFRSGVLNSLNFAPSPSIAVAAERIKKPGIPGDAEIPEKGSKVTVAILVDESGDVYAAKAADGEELLKKPSEKAALGSSFTPAEYQGTRLKMSGVLTYEFLPNDEVNVTVVELKAIYPEKLKRQIELKQKLHFWVYGVIDRFRKGEEKPAPNESRFVKSGIASVRLKIAVTSETALGKLRDAGLKIEAADGDKVRGTIPVGKLLALAELKEVKYISP